MLTVLKDSLNFSPVHKTWDILNIFLEFMFAYYTAVNVLKF